MLNVTLKNVALLAQLDSAAWHESEHVLDTEQRLNTASKTSVTTVGTVWRRFTAVLTNTTTGRDDKGV